MDRLHCRCTFSDGAQQLETLLTALSVQVEQNANHRRAVKEAQDAVVVLRALYKEHVTRYREEQNRSLVEHLKHAMPPLKTSAWTAGDVEALRAPPSRSRSASSAASGAAAAAGKTKGSKRKREHALLAKHEKLAAKAEKQQKPAAKQKRTTVQKIGI